jgi:hypothetical protein
MRPPASHIQFRIATWVPWDELTETEREEYETVKKRQQQEERQYELELQALQEAQDDEDQRKKGTTRNTEESTTKTTTTKRKNCDDEEDGNVPMSISPEKGDDTNGKTSLQETIEPTTTKTEAVGESGLAPSSTTLTMAILNNSTTPTPPPIPSKEDSPALDSERMAEATVLGAPLIPFPEATDVEESRNHKKRKIEIAEMELSDSITTSLDDSTTATMSVLETSTTFTPQPLPPDSDKRQSILAPGQATRLGDVMPEHPMDQETTTPPPMILSTTTTTSSVSSNRNSLTPKESMSLIGCSTERSSLMPSAATVENSAALAAGDAAATSTTNTPST